MITFKSTGVVPDQYLEDYIGIIPQMLDIRDPRPAVVQLNGGYAYGGGWHSFDGFTMEVNGDLSYPDDPITKCVAEAEFRNETIRVYEHAWVSIQQDDGTYTVARMD